MESLLSIIQIVVAILLIIFILVQQRGTALGSAFGGGGGGGGGGDQGFYATKRGIQQKIYWASVILGILFISLTIVSLIIK